MSTPDPREGDKIKEEEGNKLVSKKGEEEDRPILLFGKLDITNIEIEGKEEEEEDPENPEDPEDPLPPTFARTMPTAAETFLGADR
eukprot:6540733-Ditylum_brightwellii.AAC.1